MGLQWGRAVVSRSHNLLCLNYARPHLPHFLSPPQPGLGFFCPRPLLPVGRGLTVVLLSPCTSDCSAVVLNMLPPMLTLFFGPRLLDGDFDSLVSPG